MASKAELWLRWISLQNRLIRVGAGRSQNYEARVTGSRDHQSPDPSPAREVEQLVRPVANWIERMGSDMDTAIEHAADGDEQALLRAYEEVEDRLRISWNGRLHEGIMPDPHRLMVDKYERRIILEYVGTNSNRVAATEGCSRDKIRYIRTKHGIDTRGNRMGPCTRAGGCTICHDFATLTLIAQSA